MKAMIAFFVGFAAVSWGCGSGDDAPAAEKAGAFLAEQQSKFVKGLGEGLQNDGAAAGKSMAVGSGQVLQGAGEGMSQNGEATGAKVAEGVGSVLKGVFEGLDKALLQVTVAKGAGIGEAGMSVVRADQQINAESRPQVDVFIVLAKPFEGDLSLDVTDDKGVKLDTAQTRIKGGAGETVKASFVFAQDSKAAFPGVHHTLRR